MHPILLSWGGVKIYTHGLMIVLGALAGGALIFSLAKMKGFSRKFLFDILVFSLLMGIVGARLAYVIFYPYQFSSWPEILMVWHGGLVSFGGIFLGFLTAALILRKKGENIFQWFDIGIVGFLLGWAIGRIGCFLAGDVLGVFSNSSLAVGGRLPVALFESGWCLVLAITLFLLLWKGQRLLRRLFTGSLFAVGLMGYLIGRFVIDFWREDSIMHLGLIKLKAGQWSSGFCLMGMIIFFFFYLRSRKGAQNV